METKKEHLWFKRKSYGWGWTPCSWQGWTVTAMYVGGVLVWAVTIDEQSVSSEVGFTFILPVLLMTIFFITIAYKKGEKPRWQWGKRK